MESKKGVTLIILIITIIVLLILTTVAVTGISNVLIGVREKEFVSEIKTIEDKAKEYYITTSDLPISGANSYTQEMLLDLISNEYDKALLQSEISINKDNLNIFYLVDLKVLGLETSKRGKGDTQTDIFLIATNTLNVYYLKGVKISNDRYFSLVKLVENKQVLPNEKEPSSSTTLNTDINATKNKNTWTSELKIMLDVKLDQGETIQYTIAEDTNNPRNLPYGDKIITINRNTMSQSEKDAFVTNKTMKIQKKLGEEIISQKQVAINNLDIESPVSIDSYIEVTSFSTYNLIETSYEDLGGSGIKAVYYDYVSRIDKEGNEVNYYKEETGNDVTGLLASGNISKDGKIKVDKNIRSIRFACVDNAGNVSESLLFYIPEAYVVGS